MTTEIDDLRLVWPASLFAGEALQVIATGYAGDVAAVRLLFTEAFAEGIGASLVREVCEVVGPYRGAWQPDVSLSEPWVLTETDGLRPRSMSRPQNLLEEVVRRVQLNQIPAFAPKHYWSARQVTLAPSGPISEHDLRAGFLDLLRELDQIGYFDPVAGPNCCDAGVDRAVEGAAVLQGRWGKPAVWPLADEGAKWVSGLSNDEFLDLIEVFFDLVQRPRTSHWHSFCQEWDYADHDARAGQRVYTWRINALLDRSALALHLSEASEDTGLLIRTVRDGREHLPDAVARATIDPAERARIEHAIAQQRIRHATRQTRREAVRGLGDVLENRRATVRRLLGNKDESDLFQIINSFDIRHMNKFQQGNFSDDFLDYCYWTFLASIDLINTLETRPAPEGENPSAQTPG